MCVCVYVSNRGQIFLLVFLRQQKHDGWLISAVNYSLILLVP
jgi:hypothetical protein